MGPAGTDEESNQEEEGSDQEEEDQDDDDEEFEEEEDVEEEEEVKKPSKKSTAKQQDERVMMKELKQAASADVEKGRDVKKQLVSPVHHQLCNFRRLIFSSRNFSRHSATTSSNLESAYRKLRLLPTFSLNLPSRPPTSRTLLSPPTSNRLSQNSLR